MSTMIATSAADTDLCPSSWQSWASPMEVDYPATVTWTSLPQAALSPALRSGAMAMVLAGVGITGGAGLNALVGSGGSTEYLIRQDQPDAAATTPQTLGGLLATFGEQETTARSRKAAGAEVLATADLIAEIKATLGINVTDLAAMAKVSRQTIYDWLGDGQISPTNYERLFQIQQVCTEWQALAKKPVGRLIYAKSEDETSLFELLGQGILDRAAIKSQVETLAAKVAQQDAERRHRLAKLTPLSEKGQRENALTHVSLATDS